MSRQPRRIRLGHPLRRDPRGLMHSNIEPLTARSKQDICTLPVLEHVYFALTIPYLPSRKKLFLSPNTLRCTVPGGTEGP